MKLRRLRSSLKKLVLRFPLLKMCFNNLNFFNIKIVFLLKNADSTREKQPSCDAFSPLLNHLLEAPPRRRGSGRKESFPESRSLLTLEEPR